jgi:hypothetical protein
LKIITVQLSPSQIIKYLEDKNFQKFKVMMVYYHGNTEKIFSEKDFIENSSLIQKISSIQEIVLVI